MKAPIAVLIVEDSDSDAQLMVRLLKRAGHEITFEVVETAAQMRAALARAAWDIVISDYSLPQFDGRTALKVLQETGLDIPFISVSGTMGEESAVAMMKAGAHDYLMKNNLARLAPAMERELREAEVRRQRRKAEAALRDEADLLSESQRIAHIGSWLYDMTGRITWSEEAYRIWGVSPDTFVPNAEAFLNLIHPEDQAAMKEWTSACVAGEKPGSLEFRRILADGQIRFLRGRGELVRDAENRPVHMAGTIQDITEHKMAGDALQDQRNVLGMVFESVPSILMLVDYAGRVEAINRAGVAFAGRRKESLLNLLGGEVFGCVNSATGEGCGQNETCTECPVRSRVRLTVDTGEAIYNQEDCLTVLRDNKVVTIDFLISTIPLKLKSKLQVLVAITDITALKRAERERESLQVQLTQAQKLEAVGQLAGGIAHDFNNILAAMMMRLSLMQGEQFLKSEISDSLTELESDAKRAADLTRQLLLFARRQVMQVKVLDLNDLLGNLLKMLRRVLSEQINLVLEGAASPLWIEADPGMIEQVVMNLCVNARDAMPRGGNLILSAQRTEVDDQHVQIHSEAHTGGFACLTVSDEGCGIEDALVGRIFEPFFTTKEVGKGTGLGLATVHGIAKQHKGWVEVESIVGRGTSFRVFLPISTKPIESVIQEAIVPLARGSETVLVVEDEPNLRKMVVQVLRQQGYTVIEAADGVDAMRKWEEHRNKIRLLFTDMVMPSGITGLELGDKLRSLKPDLRVIIYSGYSFDLLSQTSSRPAAVTYLPKPCEPNRLIRIVREMLDSSM